MRTASPLKCVMGSEEEQPEPGRVPEKAMQLIEWMATKGAWWNSNFMQFRHSRESGIGLWAQQPVSDGDRLCQLPKAALLSVCNTNIADVLEAEELSGGLGLSFAVMFERALPESPWCACLDCSKSHSSSCMCIVCKLKRRQLCCWQNSVVLDRVSVTVLLAEQCGA